MATTLADIADQLKESNETQEDTRDAIVVLTTTFQTYFLDLQRNRLDDLEHQRQLLEALGRLQAPPPPPGPPGGGGGPQDTFSFDFAKLGMIAGGLAATVTALTAAVATTVGVMIGQLKAIQTYTKTFVPGLITVFDNFKNSFIARFTSILDDLKIRAAFIKVSITTTFTNFVNTIKNLFAVDPNSNFAKAVSVIKNSLATFAKPFVEAAQTLKQLVSPAGSPGVISRAFNLIKTALGTLGKSMATLAGTVGKLFAPIAVIITLFDTVKGAIDGYATGGILGGLQGAIDGLFTSLITKPLDLLKSGVAWVLDKLGFDETSEILRSFSFTELWTSMTSKVFDGVKVAIDWVKTLFTDPKQALIALFNAYVGVWNGIAQFIWNRAIKPATEWVMGLFGWNETTLPTWEGLTTFVTDKWTEVKTWFTNTLAWAKEGIATGWTNLTIFVTDKWTEIKTWFTDTLAWAQEGIATGWTNLTTFVSNKWIEVKQWFDDTLAWAKEGIASGWVNLTTFVTEKWIEVKQWFDDTLACASEGIAAGWTNLTTFVSDKWTEIKTWFTDTLAWASEGIAAGWTNLTTFVTEKWTEVKTWFTDTLAWASEGIAAGWTNLTTFVSGKWSSIKSWFTNEQGTGVLDFSFPTSDQIQIIFDQTVESIKTWFTDLFDFLPSVEEIKTKLSALLPDFMKPATAEEQAAEIQGEIDQLRIKRETAKTEEELAQLPARARRGQQSQQQIDAQIQALEQRLLSLRKGTQGRFFDFGAGTPVILHGREAVVPQQSNEGRILSATRSQVVADTLTELAASDRSGRFGLGNINNVLADNRQTTVVSSSTARINVTPDSHNSAWMMRRGVIPYGR